VNGNQELWMKMEIAMFCFQCQETSKNTGCTVKGVCGKLGDTANLQDLLIYVLKGIAVYDKKLNTLGKQGGKTGPFIVQCLFATITNANWDNDRFTVMIREALTRRGQLRERFLAVYRKRTARILTNRCPIPPLGFQTTLTCSQERPSP
jgi:hydroxylamine reductase